MVCLSVLSAPPTSRVCVGRASSTERTSLDRGARLIAPKASRPDRRYVVMTRFAGAAKITQRTTRASTNGFGASRYFGSGSRGIFVSTSAAASDGAGASAEENAGETRAEENAGVKEEAKEEAKGIKAWWARAAKIDRATIAALGGAALLSYGFISNLFYVSSLLLATYTTCKTCGVSPLASADAMKLFGTTYFGLWMIQNFLRPARMALSVAISPATDKLVEVFQRFVPGNRKSLAFGLTVFCVNVLGTFAYMFGGFFLIGILTGVPLDLKGLLMAAKAARAGA